MILVTTAGKVGAEAVRPLVQRGGARPRPGTRPGQGRGAGRGGRGDRRRRPGRPSEHRRRDGGRQRRVLVSPAVPAQELNVVAAPPGPASGTSSRPAARLRPTRPSPGGAARPRSRPAWPPPDSRTRCCGRTPTCRTSWRWRPRSPRPAASAPRPARDARHGRRPRRRAVAAEIAASPAPHAGKTYWLTGPELISNYDVAAVLSELLGRTITYTSSPSTRTGTR